MVRLKTLCRLLAALLFFLPALNVFAQGTAISYQGQLNVSGSPANGNYDFHFAVFDAPASGNQISYTVTNLAVPVSNGLFMVTLNFGPGVFNGTDNGSNDWLDIAVRPAGGGSFTELTPRQPILPVPYALFAVSASNVLGSLQSTQIVGVLSSSAISGTYSNSVSFVNSGNSFAGAFAGTFTGNGNGLTNLNASNLSTGTVADGLLPSDVAFLGHNQVFTGSNSFTGPGTYSGANTFNNNNNSFTGSFFGNGLVGWIAENGTSVSAARDTGYMTLNAGFTTVTLPATSSLTQVDIVRVSGAGTGGFIVRPNSGQSITGTFASYSNCIFAPLAVSGNYYDVAGSGDGVRRYAVIVGLSSGGVVSSSDSGNTWYPAGSLSGSWDSVACSANGQIVYVQPTSGNIQESINGGATWTTTGIAAGSGPITCTAGGTLIQGAGNVFCSGNGTYRVKVSSGSISYSDNSGGSYTSVNGPVSGVTSVAASSDCTRIVAAVSNGLLYASADLGASWTTLTTTNVAWSGVWMSPDGSKIAASVVTSGGLTGGIFQGTINPQPNTTATIGVTGSQGSAVELQYIGSGNFIPVGSSGLLWAN